MKKIVVSLLFIFLGYSLMAQSSTKKAIGLRLNELVNLELGAEYHRPIGRRNELSFYLGVKYYPAEEYDLSPNTQLENYFVAQVYTELLGGFLAPKPHVLKDPLNAKNVIEYYSDTKSLNKYGKVIPVVTIPLQVSIRQYLKPNPKTGTLFITAGIYLYSHWGQKVSTITTFLQAIDPVATPSITIVGKFKEEIRTSSGGVFTTTMSSGIGWQYIYKEKYFLEVSPVVEFNLQYASNTIDYHGFRQIQPRVLVVVGKLF